MHITAREIGIPDWVINLRHRLAHGPGEQNMTGLHEALKIVLKALIYNEKNYWHDQYILYQEEIEFSNRRKHFTFNSSQRNLTLDTDKCQQKTYLLSMEFKTTLSL